MGGPIVRSGASPEFTKGWERIFGGAKRAKPAKATKKKAAKKSKKSRG